jgi:hypothetical protein
VDELAHVFVVFGVAFFDREQLDNATMTEQYFHCADAIIVINILWL